MERKGVVGGLAALTFLAGVGIGAVAAEDESVELVAELTGEVAELQDVLNESRPAEEVDQLEEQIETLKSEIADAQSAVDDAEARLVEESKKHEARSADLDDREAELDDREAELDARESEVETREATSAAASSGDSGGSGSSGSQAAAQQDTRSEPEPSGGCQAGQVDINSAGLQELQRIHEIGPARAEQIIALRPFGSVDDLVRVSGIAEARLGGIKAQGIACVG